MNASRPLVVLLSLALASTPIVSAAQRSARAQPPPTAPPTPTPAEAAPTPEEARDAEARDLFERGRVAFADSHFADALDLFRQAYALSERHALLYNIGQAADRLRRDREALEAFDRYLEEVPEAANRVEVETRTAVLRETIARDEQLRAEAARPVVVEPPLVIEEQWWFWTLIGLGVAGAGVGVAAGLGAFNTTELAPQTVGDIGPGGVVVALEVRP